MIITLVLSLALASAVMYSMSDTMTAQTVSGREGNYASALAAAEYGAELAISELATGLVLKPDEFGQINDLSVVMGDFILGPNNGVGTLYQTNGIRASDQRRLGGTFNDQEFRVRVRSARLAYDNNNVGSSSTHVLPEGWLKHPGEFEYGKDKAYQFGDVYEVTSTARHTAAGTGTFTARRTESPVVQAIVNLLYSSYTGKLLDDTGVVHLEQPEHFAVTGGMTEVIDLDALALAGEPQSTKMVYNILISGEDHHLIKQHMESVVNDPIVEPLRLTTNEANYFGAYGGYWTNGQLTLNYRMSEDDANPYRPKTPSFGTGDNVAMWVQDTDRVYDTYLLGGKTSRTVNVDETKTIGGVVGQIVETSSSQANEGGNFNIVLGQFEDLRNLYINMAGVVGSYTDPTNWWQIYVGQYTNTRRSATAAVTTSLPNYAGTKIRAQTVHLMQNKEGEKLVRLYKKNNLYYKYEIYQGEWTGYYCWADATFGNTGIRLNKNVTAVGNIPGEKANEKAVGRTFFWQELVGYELVRRGENGVTTDVNEPAVIEQRDLPVSGQKIDKRTIYRTDANGERIPAGFDEIYQAYEYNTSTRRHPLYGDKYHAVSPGYLEDRNDVIYVWNNDGSVTAHKDMKSFLFEKDFGEKDDNGDPAPRQALNVFIAYEDQRETTADYNYTDMMFNIYIAPQVEAKVTDWFVVAPTSRQWWERDERDGLTGDTSHYSIGVNLSMDPEAVDPEKTLAQEHYDRFDTNVEPGESGEESLDYNVWTMRSDELGLTDFPRAVFVYEGGKYNTGKLYEQNERVAKYIQEGGNTFYYSKGDLLDYIQYFLKDKPNYDLISSGWYSSELLEWNYDLALDGNGGDIDGIKGLNPGYNFIDIDERWAMIDKNRTTLDAGDSVIVVHDPIRVRDLAGAIVGSHAQNVPIISTRYFSPEQNAEASIKNMSFIAGEMDLSSVSNLNDGIITGVALPARMDLLTFPEEQDDGTLRTDTVKVFSSANPEIAVSMCYENYYAGDLANQNYLISEYGVKEKRYSIGFHRGGTDKVLRPNLQQDHYEIALLTQEGFNPYREANSGKRFIANDLGNYHPFYRDIELRSVVSNYPATGGEAPDFVFEDPIDGAGALVVNGNLIIKDTFAYYGTLVVLGDIRIIPTLKTEMVMNTEGNPVDYRGHSLYLKEKSYEGEPDQWYYVWQYIDEEEGVIHGGDEDADRTFIQLKTDKTPLLDDNGNEIPVEPFTQKVVRGELIIQGNMAVKGRIFTEKLDIDIEPGTVIVEPPTIIYVQSPVESEAAYASPNDETRVKTYYGKLTALWSREAVSAIAGVWSRGGETVGRISWIHNDDIPVDSIWNDVHDTRTAD